MRKSTSESKHIVVLREKNWGINNIHWHQRAFLIKWFNSADNLGKKQKTSYSRLHNGINKE